MIKGQNTKLHEKRITSLLKTNANIDLPFRNNYRIIENHFHYSDLETIAVLFEINFYIDFWVRNK